MTTTTDTLAKVPHPAGATHVDDWYDLKFGIDNARRFFTGSWRVVEREGPIDHDITVQIDGTQGTAGDVTRHLMITEGNREAIELSSSDHARQFGRALIAAADEWEQMAAYDTLIDAADRRR
jgi:hypothetical protein